MAALVTAKGLNMLVDQRKAEKSVTFNRILEMCISKIRKYAQNQQYRCVYEVPEFLLGYPLFNMNDALVYIIDYLQNRCGLLVRYFFPKLLYVSWDYGEISGKKVMTPFPSSLSQSPSSSVDARRREEINYPSQLPMHPLSSVPSSPPRPFPPLPTPTVRRPFPAIGSASAKPRTMVPAQLNHVPFTREIDAQAHAANNMLPLPTPSRPKRRKDCDDGATRESPSRQEGRQQGKMTTAGKAPSTTAFRSISDFKPSGKFVLNLDG